MVQLPPKIQYIIFKEVSEDMLEFMALLTHKNILLILKCYLYFKNTIFIKNIQQTSAEEEKLFVDSNSFSRNFACQRSGYIILF